MRGLSTPSLSQRGSVLRGGTPFGHPSDENGRGLPRPYVKTRAARGKRRARKDAPAGLTGRPYSARAGAIPSWGMPANSTHPRRQHKRGDGCRPLPAPDAGAMPKARVSRIGVRGKADCGTQAERMWSRGPAGSVTRRRFACFAAGGKVGRPAGRNPPTNPMTETETGVRRPPHPSRHTPRHLPPVGEGFMLAHRIFCRAHHDEKIKS